MALHLIIDGYNLIKNSPSLSALDRQDLQLGREALIDLLADYKKVKSHKITVVFDGAGALDIKLSRERIKGIHVVFSRHGQTADAVIKNMASREREKALIVSSDRDIVVFAMSHGAAVVSSLHFEEKIAQAAPAADDGFPALDAKSWNPSTKKKGPGRRLSKRERKNKIKTRKL